MFAPSKPSRMACAPIPAGLTEWSWFLLCGASWLIDTNEIADVANLNEHITFRAADVESNRRISDADPAESGLSD